MRAIGLRRRVTIAFAVLGVFVAAVMAVTTYQLVRSLVTDQRETTEYNRAADDAVRVQAALVAGRRDYPALLGELGGTGRSRLLLLVDGQWYGSSVGFSPELLPASLLEEAEGASATQRFDADGSLFLGTAFDLDRALFVEVLSLDQLQGLLSTLAVSLALAGAPALVLGAWLGASAGRRLLRPLQRLGQGAQRIAAGDVGARVPVGADPDLAPIATAFNTMAESVGSRLARERRFASDVSHELRSPLTAMLTTVDILENRLPTMPERDAALVSLLCAKVRRFSHMVVDLLEVSRVTAEAELQPTLVDLAAATRLQVEARGISPRCVVGNASVITDARRLERILGNLVDNAERHGGGLVRISIRQTGTGATIQVDDSGPGLSQERFEELSEPFARGDSGGPDGLGLGLTLVREHARAIGAAIRVERSPENGSRFVLSLPGSAL
jgi:two-component system, OmpR family, sensor histidine kinase MtrB